MSNLATQQQEGEERPSGMSSSGSSASLTSESSFDPNDPETYSQPGSSSASKPAPLGIVEIARMARNDRKARKASRSPVQERGPILLLSPPVSPGVNSAMGMLGEGDVFARDVVIKGWKIVGGKGFGDKAKVGAYVVYDIELVTKSGGSISIMRRYTDFVTLREGLKARYPNLRAAIPKLPGRVHMSKFSEKLLADRQPRLQRFLRTILLHPDMGRGGVGSVVGEWVISGTTHSAHATSPGAGGPR